MENKSPRPSHPNWTRLLPLMLASSVLLISSRASAAEPPRVWAIVVGIDAYDDPAIPKCLNASTEARAIRRWLVEVAGWDGRQVLVMDGSSQARHGPPAQEIRNLRPTRENLEWAVRQWLPHRARPGDLVLVAFAGQAIGGKVSDPTSRDRLLPIDARSDDLDATGWSLPDSLDTIAAKGENPILCWLDTSLSGRGKPAAKLDGRRASATRFLGEMTRWPGTSAWIAADGRATREPGVFVKTVLAAMGTPEKPVNLLGALFLAGRDAVLAEQGFRAAGALGPGMSLWPKMLAEVTPAPSELLLQRGHADRVTALAFSADGATTITASMDSTIKIWRTADRTLLRTLAAHTVGVTALALSPDGKTLASGDGAGRVILWTLDDLLPHRFTGPNPHDRGIAKVEFLGVGSTFATIDLSGKVVLWTFADRKLAATMLVAKAGAMAAGSGRVAAWVDGATVKLFDASGKTVRDLLGLTDRVTVGAIAIRGDRLAAGDKSGAVCVWNLNDGAVVGRFQAKAPIEAVALTRGATVAVAGESAWFVRDDGKNPPTAEALGGHGARVAASIDGRSVAATTTDGGVEAWRIDEKGKVAAIAIEEATEPRHATIAGFPPNADRLVSGDQDGGIRAWDWPSGKFASLIKPGRGKIEAASASSDGRCRKRFGREHRYSRRYTAPTPIASSTSSSRACIRACDAGSRSS